MPAHFFEAHLNASISAIFSFSRGTWLRLYQGDGIDRMDDEEMMDVLDIPSGYD